MDPLTILASVVGLLTAAAQVSFKLASLISESEYAPKSLGDLKAEVDAVHLALGQLQAFLLRKASANSSQAALVLVDHVVAALSACVLTFSELDVIIQRFASDDRMGLMDRIRWVAKAETIVGIMVKVQNHKTSMILMLQILQSQSQLEGERALDQLTNMIKRLMSHHPILQQRLRGPNPEASALGAEDEAAADAPLSTGLSTDSQPQRYGISLEIEDHLNESWVYSRSRRKTTNADSISLPSLDRRTATSWSFFAGLSIAEVSTVSVLELPIYIDDISNASNYRFGTPSVDQQRPLTKVTQSSGIFNRVSALYSNGRLRRDADRYEKLAYPLHVACQDGRADVAEELLKRGADVNSQITDSSAIWDTPDERRRCITPLLVATKHRHRPVFDILIRQRGIDVALKRAHGITCLHMAAVWGDLDIFETLLDLGCDPLTPDSTDTTPWHLAASHGHIDVLRKISDAVKERLDFSVDLPAIDGSTALINAAREGHTLVCTYLLELEADLEHSTDWGFTPAMAAAAADDSSTLQLLLSQGAKLSQRTRYGESALHFAAMFGRTDNLQICLDNGADVDIENEFGETALLVAATWAADWKACSFLLKNNASSNIRNIFGMTVLDYVPENSVTKVVFEAHLIDYEPWTPEMKRRRRLGGIRRALNSHRWKLPISSENSWLDYYPLAVLFLAHGECDDEAKICFETGLVRRLDDHCRCYQTCRGCKSMVAKSWFACRQCYKRILCYTCHSRRRELSYEASGLCQKAHTYLEFGGKEWRELPAGKVNQKGQTLGEWREEQRLIYTEN